MPALSTALLVAAIAGHAESAMFWKRPGVEVMWKYYV